MKKGFSLVELSIVLVILGLLVGGILAGQSLIKASEVRAISTEYNRWVSATHAFRDKYLALPGDMNNATRFWGRAAAVADCITNSASAVTSPGACDGDGDGNIEAGVNTTGASAEMFQYWKELANAGLIEGSYSGVNGGDGDTAVIGTNVPGSKFGQAGWTVSYADITVGSSFFNANYNQNSFIFGLVFTNDITSVAALKPEEAWNIDTKLDDGKPATGKVMGGRWGTCTNATSNTDTASTYALTSTATGCALIFQPAF